MERDDDNPPPPGSPPRPEHRSPSSLAGYLKRIRQAFRPRSSNKAAKTSLFASPGQASLGSRAPLQHPLGQPVSPSPNAPVGSSVQNDSPGHGSGDAAPVESISNAGTAAPNLSTATLAHRPRLPPSAASEGNIITCPQPPALALQEFHSIPRPSLSRPESSPTPDVVPRRTQRAEELFEKYGVPLEPDGYFYCEGHAHEHPDPSEERVKKEIRVRIHHHCHRCNLGIGPNGICVNCGHKKCRKCTQWPQKRPDAEEGSSKKRPAPHSVASSSKRTETLDAWLAAPIPTTTQSSRILTSSLFAGPRSLWSSRVVRRLCHHCHSPFVWTETVCQDCDHTLCEACPRDPPLSQPDSSSAAEQSDSAVNISFPQRRERTLRKPRIRVKYNCENCGLLYKEGSKLCDQCGHVRCDKCPRFPPRTDPRPAPDPTILRALQQRLDSFS